MAAQGVLPHATCLPIEDVSERRNIDAAGVLGPASFSRVSGVCFFLGLGVESAAARAVAVKQTAGVMDIARVVVLIGWGRVIKSALRDVSSLAAVTSLSIVFPCPLIVPLLWDLLEKCMFPKHLPLQAKSLLSLPYDV